MGQISGTGWEAGALSLVGNHHKQSHTVSAHTAVNSKSQGSTRPRPNTESRSKEEKNWQEVLNGKQIFPSCHTSKCQGAGIQRLTPRFPNPLLGLCPSPQSHTQHATEHALYSTHLYKQFFHCFCPSFLHASHNHPLGTCFAHICWPLQWGHIWDSQSCCPRRW